ncbi:MAG: TSUP family transporter [Rhodobacteraceae bacterium]|nr:TSUP family transporter [Paracoccaceae bacterium]
MFGMQPEIFAAVIAITLFASFVKGAVGFAMPMIMISGLASLLPAHEALAALILPTVVTNLFQAFRQGGRAALDTMRDWWRLIVTTCLFIALSSQLVLLIPQPVLLGALGVPIVIFALTQLLGRQIRFHAHNRALAEVLTGALGGFYGGLSGVWGPPIIALLLSLGIEKRESVRVQGVVYMIGAAMLFMAHLRSGVLNAQTLPLSALLVLPAVIGLWTGFRLHDRLDPARFRRWTLVILAVSGLNLIRRALSM